MKVKTIGFGEVEVPEHRLMVFPAGILGFPGFTRYALIDISPDNPFKWLQCTEAVAPAFIVMDPRLFKPDYVVRVPAGELEDIELQDPSRAVVWVILTRSRTGDELTGNLKGPLVVNPDNGLAKQLVLADPDYPTRYVIFAGGAPEGEQGDASC